MNHKNTPRAPAHYQAPLVVHTLHHPKSRNGPRFAAAVYNALTRPSADAVAAGPGIPVVHDAPVKADLAQAGLLLTLVYVDRTLLLDAQWQQTVLFPLSRRIRRWGGAKLILVTRVEGALTGQLQSAVRVKVTSTAGDLDLAKVVGGVLAALKGSTSPLRILSCHSHQRTPPRASAAGQLHRYLNAHLGASIRAARRLDDIDTSVADILVGFHDDAYAAAEWCRTSNLIAKQRGMPAIIINAIEDGEASSPPYLCNTPTVRWLNTKQRKAHIALRVTATALQHEHFKRLAAALAALSNVPIDPYVLSRPPELLDVGHDNAFVLYPEPPISKPETEVLRQHLPQFRGVTPTMLANPVLAAETRGALTGIRVALSVSNSEKPRQGGLNDHHLDDFVVQLSRYLMSGGATIAYGGDLRRAGFSTLLYRIVNAQNRRGGQSFKRIESVLAQYLQRGLTTLDDATLDNVAFTRLPAPAGKRIDNRTSDGARIARIAFQLSDMREHIVKEISREENGFTAHVVLGGRIVGSSGRFPGLLEEVALSIRHQNPTYIVGGFGGAATEIVKIITGKKVPIWTEKALLSHPKYGKKHRTLHHHLKTEKVTHPSWPASIDALVDELRGNTHALRDGDDNTRWYNGLTAAENRILFQTRQMALAVMLILRGLCRLADDQRQRRPQPLPVRLHQGSVDDREARNGAYLFGSVRGVLPAGAGRAFDDTVGGVVHDAHRRGKLDMPAGGIHAIHTARGTVMMASLGDMDEVTAAVVERASDEAFDSCLRAGVWGVTTVAMGASCGISVAAAIDALVGGARRAWQDRGFDPRCKGLTICEVDAKRRKHIRAALNRLAKAGTVVLGPETEGPTLTTSAKGASTLHLQLSMSRNDIHTKLAWTLMDDAPPAGVLSESLTVPTEEFTELTAPFLDRPIEQDFEKLFRRVLPESIRKRITAAEEAPLYLVHKPEDGAIPLEGLMSQQLLTASVTSVARRLVIDKFLPQRGRPPRQFGDRLAVLLVVDPTGDLSGALREGKAVMEALNDVATVKQLVQEQATRTAILDELRSGNYDVLHYAGHAFFNSESPHLSGLRCHGDEILTSTDLNDIARLPALAFINACQSARMRNNKVAADPSTTRQLPPEERIGVAEKLIRAGLCNYLGTYWPVGDAAAETFARTFYRQLVNNASIGHAIMQGRKAIQDSVHARGYLFYGQHDYHIG